MTAASTRSRVQQASRALLAMALLGASALIGLSTGSAQAAWTTTPPTPPSAPYDSFKCTFDVGGCTVGEITPGAVDDKWLTLLGWNSIPAGSDLEFSYQPTDSASPWHVDLDFNPDDSDGGSLSYKIESTRDSFSLVNLISARDGEETSVKKVYGTRLLADGYTVDPDSVIDTLILSSNVSDKGPAYGRLLYVNDSWEGSGTIDNISNEYQQSVPGPLPLFGCGAAFGLSRRLRQRLKGAARARA